MRNFIKSVLSTDLTKSSGIIFIATLLGNLIVFLVDTYLSEFLGPESFGVFRTIFYLFSFLPLLIDMGINLTLTKYISNLRKENKGKASYLTKSFLKIKAVLFLALSLSTILLSDQISTVFFGDASFGYLMLPGAFMSLMFFFTVFQYILLGFQEYRLFALSQFSVLFGSAIIGLLMSRFGLFWLIAGWGLGILAGNMFSLGYFLKKGVIKNSKPFDVKKIFFGYSLPVHAVFIINSIYFVIVPILSIFFPEELIGYFSFAFLFYFAATMIPNAVSYVILPQVSEMSGPNIRKNARSLLRKALLLYTPLVIAGIAAAFMLSGTVFVTFFPSYLPSLFIFKIVVSMGLLFGYNIIYTYYLQGLGRLKRFAVLAIIQNITLLAVSFGLLSNA